MLDAGEAELTVGQTGPPRDPADRPMSWVKRLAIAVFVVAAITLVVSGVLVIRHVLDHSVDPATLRASSATRLTTLDPVISGLIRQGTDTLAMVDCEQQYCASAARTYLPAGGMTTAALVSAADAWASTSGLGSPVGDLERQIGCGTLAYAPVRAADLCDLGGYDVPGQTGQQVHVYARLQLKGKTTGPVAGAYPLSTLGLARVLSVGVQVITSTPWPGG